MFANIVQPRSFDDLAKHGFRQSAGINDGGCTSGTHSSVDPRIFSVPKCPTRLARLASENGLNIWLRRKRYPFRRLGLLIAIHSETRSFLLPMWRRRTIYIAIQRRMGTSATRISAPISITNPTSIPASAFPRSSGFYLFGFLAWSSAFKARRTHDIGCFLRQNQSGECGEHWRLPGGAMRTRRRAPSPVQADR